MSFPGEYRVEWMSPEETYMHLESAGSKIYRGLVESVGMKKSAGEQKQTNKTAKIENYLIMY